MKNDGRRNTEESTSQDNRTKVKSDDGGKGHVVLIPRGETKELKMNRISSNWVGSFTGTAHEGEKNTSHQRQILQKGGQGLRTSESETWFKNPKTLQKDAKKSLKV